MGNLIVIVMGLESFPTGYRGAVSGICIVSCCVGGLIAPLINGLAPNYILYIFGSFALVSALMALFLRETKGRPLQDFS